MEPLAQRLRSIAQTQTSFLASIYHFFPSPFSCLPCSTNYQYCSDHAQLQICNFMACSHYLAAYPRRSPQPPYFYFAIQGSAPAQILAPIVLQLSLTVFELPILIFVMFTSLIFIPIAFLDSNMCIFHILTCENRVLLIIMGPQI